MKPVQKLRSVFAFVLLLGSSTASFSQTLKEFFSDRNTQLTYLGIDYTKNLVINDADANTADITGRLYNAMNDLVVKEQESKNYDIGRAFSRKAAINIDISAVTSNNARIDPKKILSSSSADFKRLKEADIKASVEALALEGKEGIGLVFIMEGMKKYDSKGYASVWITLINMKTKEVLMTQRTEHEADGFGFRNYWVSVIRRTIGDIDWSRYKDWKKTYSR